MTFSGNPSRTDWERVRRSIALEELIAYDENDPDDGPDDPDDDHAVDRFLTGANLVHPVSPQRTESVPKAS